MRKLGQGLKGIGSCLIDFRGRVQHRSASVRKRHDERPTSRPTSDQANLPYALYREGFPTDDFSSTS